jgi:uncharacterized protein (DUF736 family)
MTEYNNDNTGALFKNDKKESDKHPDYRGTITIAGVEYWQSAWISKSKSGATYMSQKFTPKDEAKSAPKPAASQPDPFDAEIPF